MGDDVNIDFDDDADTTSTMFVSSASPRRRRRRATMNATIARMINNATIAPTMPPISAPSIEEDVVVLCSVTLIALFVDCVVGGVVADATSVFVVLVVTLVDIVIVVLVVAGVVAVAWLLQVQLEGEFEQSNRFESSLPNCNTLIDQES
jgi:hypothetical protein